MNKMEYIWTNKYVNDLALVVRKLDDDTIYEACMIEASRNKDEALVLYTMVKERLRQTM